MSFELSEILYPVFQPIVDLSSGLISHHEVLMRMHGDAGGASHVSLIRLAEACGFIGLLDCSVMEMGIGYARSRSASTAISVNISSLSLVSSMDKVGQILARNAAFCRQVIFEITETSPILNLHDAMSFATMARSFGCRIAVDDYGQNLDYEPFTPEIIRMLRPDYIKIDGRVLGVAMVQNDASELLCIARIANHIGAEVVAEYVDSLEKVDMLKRSGIRYAQGWYFGAAERNLRDSLRET